MNRSGCAPGDDATTSVPQSPPQAPFLADYHPPLTEGAERAGARRKSSSTQGEGYVAPTLRKPASDAVLVRNGPRGSRLDVTPRRVPGPESLDRGSNPGPSPYRGDALPTALSRRGEWEDSRLPPRPVLAGLPHEATTLGSQGAALRAAQCPHPHRIGSERGAGERVMLALPAPQGSDPEPVAGEGSSATLRLPQTRRSEAWWTAWP